MTFGLSAANGNGGPPIRPIGGPPAIGLNGAIGAKGIPGGGGNPKGIPNGNPGGPGYIEGMPGGTGIPGIIPVGSIMPVGGPIDGSIAGA
jgi:hypothetical protein